MILRRYIRINEIQGTNLKKFDASPYYINYNPISKKDVLPLIQEATYLSYAMNSICVCIISDKNEEFVICSDSGNLIFFNAKECASDKADVLLRNGKALKYSKGDYVEF